MSSISLHMLARKVRPYRRKTAGTRCHCFTDPVSRCTTCYGTGIVGGYEEGDVILALKRSEWELVVRSSDLVFVPGDAFIFEKIKRVVRNAQVVAGPDGVTFYVLDLAPVPLSDPLASFPMKEAEVH